MNQNHKPVQPTRNVQAKPVRRKQENRSKRRKSSIPWGDWVFIGFFGLFAAAILIAGFLFGLFTLNVSSENIMPDVQVGDQPVGGMNHQQAVDAINLYWNGEKTMIVTDGTHAWEDYAREFGLWVDAEATYERAHEMGRGPNGLEELFSWISNGSWSVMPVVTLNEDLLSAKLDIYEDLVYRPPYDAALDFQNGSWIILPAENGLALDTESAREKFIENSSLITGSGYLELPLISLPPAFSEVSFNLESIESQLNTPLKLHLYDPFTDSAQDWEVSPAAFASWVRVETASGEPNPVFAVDPLNSYLESWAVQNLQSDRTIQPLFDTELLSTAWNNNQAYTLITWYQPKEYIVQPGDMLSGIAYEQRMPYWKILEANPTIDPENLLYDTTLIIPSPNELLPLPIVENKRIVISITQQRMWTYENGQLLNEYIISTGIDDSPTMPGVYQIRTHEENAYASVWDLYMPHFLGIYEGWPGFMNGIHGLPTLSSGVRLWESVLGSKASYGCIILNLQAADTVYHWAEEGVVVEIQP